MGIVKVKTYRIGVMNYVHLQTETLEELHMRIQGAGPMVSKIDWLIQQERSRTERA